MKYDRFEDLPVWQTAADLAAAMFAWTTHPAFKGKGDLANQVQRAALSVSNNVAEGFERGTTSELTTFLYYARGSAGEVRSMLCVMERMEAFANLRTEIANHKTTCESISRQIRGWANSLQNSDITGQRHLSDQTRKSYERRIRANVFSETQRQWRIDHEQRLKSQAAINRKPESEYQDRAVEPTRTDRVQDRDG